MTKRPLVSVLTGTYRRPHLLAGCIENVRAQTYRPLEHVVVWDERDWDARERVLADQAAYLESNRFDDVVDLRVVELGRNWTTFLTNSRNAVPFQVANWIAAGDYQVWLADDERMLVPDYIERMVRVIEETGVDFVYPNVEAYFAWDEARRFVIGTDPPQNGQVTHALHRTALLDVDGGGFRIHVGSGSDWDQFERWMKAGKTWTHVPETLVSHRIDG
jgi:hypothetical protein